MGRRITGEFNCLVFFFSWIVLSFALIKMCLVFKMISIIFKTDSLFFFKAVAVINNPARVFSPRGSLRDNPAAQSSSSLTEQFQDLPPTPGSTQGLESSPPSKTRICKAFLLFHLSIGEPIKHSGNLNDKQETASHYLYEIEITISHLLRAAATFPFYLR